MPTDNMEIINAQIQMVIYNPQLRRKLFPEEEKEHRKGTRGTGDLLYNDKHNIKNTKTIRKNLALAWINSKNAYGRVPQAG